MATDALVVAEGHARGGVDGDAVWSSKQAKRNGMSEEPADGHPQRSSMICAPSWLLQVDPVMVVSVPETSKQSGGARGVNRTRETLELND